MNFTRILNFLFLFVAIIILKTGIEAIGGKEFFSLTKWMFLFLGIYLVLRFIRLKQERDRE